MWKAPRRAQARERTSLFLGLSTACSILSPPPASGRGAGGRGEKRSWGLHIRCPPSITWPQGGLEGVPQGGVAPPDPIHPLPPRLGNRRNPTARQRPRAEAARRPGERAGVPGMRRKLLQDIGGKRFKSAHHTVSRSFSDQDSPLKARPRQRL